MIETIMTIILMTAIGAWFLYSIHITDKLDRCEKTNEYLRKKMEEKQ